VKSPREVLAEVERIEDPLVRAEALYYLLVAALLMGAPRGRKR